MYDDHEVSNNGFLWFGAWFIHGLRSILGNKNAWYCKSETFGSKYKKNRRR